ncbi:EamA family transporter [Mycolicibacterium litorale]|uniref:Membrane protein n=1 Tax=Mycolicibacterium litorale TaxID=758802 RepID=A0AAD1MTE1_9MYCO|nr:EamA family transporter [Mycolicibacterium litorale]MCV7414924.1 EamA family transporter [Mycolicibacterium litorale]TDY08170.1 inner membrane transporter RhtA [Mycolicibacterium litorale]BBY16093.1 membrane protein [Mycolicibacterium litorale]
MTGDHARNGVLMAIAAQVSVQMGMAVAVSLIDRIGSDGTAWLRLAWAGVLLLVVVRPRPSAFTWRTFGMCVVLGCVTAAISLLFMASLDRIALGTATALEFLGPLAVAVVHGKGRHRLLWPGLAAIGVVLLCQPFDGGIDPKGAMLAIAAGVCWAIYILLTQRVGDEVSGVNGLAVSMPVAAVVSSFFVSTAVFGKMTPELLLIGLGMAVLLPVLPYVLELLALRRLTTAAFGTLMSLEPAFALVVGFLLLDQEPGVAGVLGIAAVVAAGIGAARGGGREMAVPLEVG